MNLEQQTYALEHHRDSTQAGSPSSFQVNQKIANMLSISSNPDHQLALGMTLTQMAQGLGNLLKGIDVL
jgi:hypothetical protein